MFRRSTSQNVNLVPAAPIILNGCVASDGNHRLRQVARVGNREVARYELQLAPKHVIPNSNKRDILRRAFRFGDGASNQSKWLLQ